MRKKQFFMPQKITKFKYTEINQNIRNNVIKKIFF